MIPGTHPPEVPMTRRLSFAFLCATLCFATACSGSDSDDSTDDASQADAAVDVSADAGGDTAEDTGDDATGDDTGGDDTGGDDAADSTEDASDDAAPDTADGAGDAAGDTAADTAEDAGSDAPTDGDTTDSSDTDDDTAPDTSEDTADDTPTDTAEERLASNGCTYDAATDMTDVPAVNITGIQSWNIPHEVCVIVSAGTVVTWTGNFTSHPLAGGETGTVDDASPITEAGPGSGSATITAILADAGDYPYFCIYVSDCNCSYLPRSSPWRRATRATS